jgi:hypothetical protein
MVTADETPIAKPWIEVPQANFSSLEEFAIWM